MHKKMILRYPKIKPFKSAANINGCSETQAAINIFRCLIPA
jgi:hypothetical protein